MHWKHSRGSARRFSGSPHITENVVLHLTVNLKLGARLTIKLILIWEPFGSSSLCLVLKSNSEESRVLIFRM